MRVSRIYPGPDGTSFSPGDASRRVFDFHGPGRRQFVVTLSAWQR